MAFSAGDRVRCYNSPSNVHEVVETDVPRDVEIEDYKHVWRLPSGDTLIRDTTREGYYMVVSEDSLHSVN